MEEILFRNIDDIKTIEAVPLQERVTTRSTYELLTRGAAIDPGKVALYFLLSGETWDSPVEVTYRQLLGRITQSANLFIDLRGGSAGRRHVHPP